MGCVSFPKCRAISLHFKIVFLKNDILISFALGLFNTITENLPLRFYNLAKREDRYRIASGISIDSVESIMVTLYHVICGPCCYMTQMIETM